MGSGRMDREQYKMYKTLEGQRHRNIKMDNLFVFSVLQKYILNTITTTSTTVTTRTNATVTTTITRVITKVQV